MNFLSSPLVIHAHLHLFFIQFSYSMNPRFRFILRYYSSKKPTFHVTPPESIANANANAVRTSNSPGKSKHKGKLLILVGSLALVTSVISVNYQKNKPIEFLE
ncbi:hypothetical protein SMKI_11G1840 [Saccharomyces mikatae IFO 1815]|uniref:Uncharacterized protein n=1 Tax=Saccharomyces mikatae IFO 1815 TaxID=226126 RepID=A0AA35IS19_SACMI|nr:uncharacterized protein SMKI_11G1840 [Saccharomyces mikatae IFO 1815]CAI4034734.1 hypothetical protein SMKI_11G1840 [Saccharomyces mikatae IFO 1815]